MSNNMNAVVNSKAAQSIVAKNYDPMISNLTTLEIKNKTVDNYYNQIKNNFYLGVKAHCVEAFIEDGPSHTMSMTAVHEGSVLVTQFMLYPFGD